MHVSYACIVGKQLHARELNTIACISKKSAADSHTLNMPTIL